MFRSTLDQLATAAQSSKTKQVLEIPIGDVDPDPDQPRKTFEGLEDLAASIVAIGIKQPLLVRPHPEERNRYLLIAGERRHRAAAEKACSSRPRPTASLQPSPRESHYYKLVRAGRGPRTIREGGRHVVLVDDAHQWLRQLATNRPRTRP